ncbi:MAG: class I SAM-dependent methyltransferase [Colwelliaceae bacterium]|jgi:predicted methyltransferase|nr:class I SAM-dependent methyltransferase [Colwelliaceae bacterium]
MKLTAKNIMTVLFGVTICSGALADERISQQKLNGFLSSEYRAKNDSARDNSRKPAQIMYFSELAKGDNVVDLFAGGGWYTELFSMAVGDSGKVYAQNDNVIWQFAEKGITERTKANRLKNVQRLDKIEIVDMPIQNNSIDLVFTALNYHDLFFTHSVREGKITQFRENVIDHKAALAKIYDILNEDGVFVIIDHIGVAGSGFNAPNDVHRIDPEIVKYQMNEAGFDLIEEAFYLRNDKDDLTSHVFAEGVRGKTNRFVYKYMKSKP